MAAKTTIKVATITAAASDDAYKLNEDAFSSQSWTDFNVLGNDPGSAKLYSVAQNIGGLSATTQFPVNDVATLDSGARISINADGTIHYDAGSLNMGSIQSLAAGETFHDTFIYTVRMANGALSTAQVSVDIVGENDAATITGYQGPLTVSEDAAAPAGGTVTVNDVDHGQAHTQAVALTATSDGAGAFAVDADGNWSFAVNHDAVQHLAATDSLTETFTIKSLDGTASQDVTVVIQGANDAAAIGGTQSGAVAEDGILTAAGKLTVADVDDGESSFAEVKADALHGAYGDFLFDAKTGDWSYALRNGDANVQALTAADSVTESLTVWSADGTASETIKVTVNGADDVMSFVLPTRGTTTTTFGGGNVTGTSGNDLIVGNPSADTLVGGAGDDTISGNQGADKITGGAGDDYLSGGTGKDIFYYAKAADATDVITDFLVGTDKLDFSGAITSGGASYQIIPVDTTGDQVADSDLVQVDSNGAADGGTLTDMVVLVGVTNLSAGDILWHG